jgi:hypothetical protein
VQFAFAHATTCQAMIDEAVTFNYQDQQKPPRADSLLQPSVKRPAAQPKRKKVKTEPKPEPKTEPKDAASAATAPTSAAQPSAASSLAAASSGQHSAPHASASAAPSSNNSGGGSSNAALPFPPFQMKPMPGAPAAEAKRRFASPAYSLPHVHSAAFVAALRSLQKTDEWARCIKWYKELSSVEV